jgi:predicted nucleotidyltransferase component of viral defense system
VTIHSADKLKTLVRAMAQGDSAKVQIIFRNYVMERFLERLSLSPYRNELILKGGALVAAMVGLASRSTLDVDTTMKNLPMSEDSVRRIVEEIAAIDVPDGMAFEITSVGTIMDEADYPGVRVMMEAAMGTMRTPLKIDFSTGDALTPREVSFSYPLLFEDRAIIVMAYNTETLLAEKLETLLTRGTANTRMRDFYDIYILTVARQGKTDPAVLRAAFANTCANRGSSTVVGGMAQIVDEVEASPAMAALWQNYRRKFDYAFVIEWSDAMAAARTLFAIVRAAKQHHS